METNIKKLSYSETLDCELALSHILARYEKYSTSIGDSGYRMVNRIALSSDEVKALSQLHELLEAKLYD